MDKETREKVLLETSSLNYCIGSISRAIQNELDESFQIVNSARGDDLDSAFNDRKIWGDGDTLYELAKAFREGDEENFLNYFKGEELIEKVFNIYNKYRNMERWRANVLLEYGSLNRVTNFIDWENFIRYSMYIALMNHLNNVKSTYITGKLLETVEKKVKETK